ncbi:glycoside hydrolase family 125 protein [Bifidobacterium catenulatum]
MPNSYARPWFSWANMMLCELVMDYFGIHVKL